MKFDILDDLAPFPTFASRVAAWCIDVFVVWLAVVAAGIGFGAAGDAATSMAFASGLVGGFLGAGAALLYLPLCEGGRSGQTLGKRVCGLRVVRAADARPLGFAHAFGRLLARMADAFGIGLLWAAIDPYGRAFHDHLAATVVVDARRVPAAQEATGERTVATAPERGASV